MITFVHKGDLSKTENFLKRSENISQKSNFDKYGKEGVIALSKATPIDSGETANSWYYQVDFNKTGVSITWLNSNVNQGVPIAIIIQYGHGTNNGGYVQGRDYINPAIRPIFDKMSQEIWREVTKS